MLDRIVGKLRGDGVGATLARGAGGTFVVTALGTAAMYGVHVLLARVMGVDRYGVFAYVLTWTTMLLLLTKFGMDTSIVRYVAAYKAKEEWGLLRGILRRADRIGIGASVVVGAACGFVVWMLSPRLTPQLALTFWIGCGVLAVQTLVVLRQAALTALGHVVVGRALYQLLRPLLFAAAVGGVLLVTTRTIDGPAAMALNGLAFVVCLLVGAIVARRYVPAPAAGASPEYRDREWLGMALPMLLTSGMFLLLQRTDILMIGAILGTQKAGIYHAASRSAGLVFLGFSAASAAFAPIVSSLYSCGRTRDLQRLLTLAARAMLAFCVPGGLVLILAGRHILGIFGEEFHAGYWALVILTAGQCMCVLPGPVALLMAMTGHQKAVAGIVTTCTLLNIVLNAILVRGFGLEGAAVATAATTMLMCLAMLVYALRYLHVNPTAFSSIPGDTG